MRLVAILSPFSGNERRNKAYAQRALLDSIRRGEAPFASHLLYPQVLSERPKDRASGMACGQAWLAVVDAAVVYGDLGMSSGMLDEIAVAREAGIEVEIRMIGKAKRGKRAKKAPETKEAPPPAKKKAAKKPAKDGAPGKRRTRDQLRAEVLKLLPRGSKGLTKKALRGALHCSGATLGRVLDGLVKDGSVVSGGESRTAKYRARVKGPDAGVQGAVDDVLA